MDQLKRFKMGYYNSSDVDTQIKAGWYDWFCKDASLANKTQTLYRKVEQICWSTRFDIRKVYVFFKNNCPVVGTLYDDFRICDLKTGDVLFTITPSCGHRMEKGLAQVYGRENKFNEPLVSGTWQDVLDYFNPKL